jgi:hypothetical protein
MIDVKGKGLMPAYLLEESAPAISAQTP